MSRKYLSVLAACVSILAAADVRAAEIHDALEAANAEKARKILEANAENATAKGEYGVTPLHLAAKKGLKDIAKLLLQKGADVNVKDDAGDTPLHTAAAYGQRELVKFLLSNKANVNAESKYGGTPLHRAALMGHKEVASVLLDNHANVNARNARGQTPLNVALANADGEVKGRADVAELLRKRGGLLGKDIKDTK